jgi:hypothetical protein
MPHRTLTRYEQHSEKVGGREKILCVARKTRSCGTPPQLGDRIAPSFPIADAFPIAQQRAMMAR